MKEDMRAKLSQLPDPQLRVPGGMDFRRAVYREMSDLAHSLLEAHQDPFDDIDSLEVRMVDGYSSFARASARIVGQSNALALGANIPSGLREAMWDRVAEDLRRARAPGYAVLSHARKLGRPYDIACAQASGVFTLASKEEVIAFLRDFGMPLEHRGVTGMESLVLEAEERYTEYAAATLLAAEICEVLGTNLPSAGPYHRSRQWTLPTLENGFLVMFAGPEYLARLGLALGQA